MFLLFVQLVIPIALLAALASKTRKKLTKAMQAAAVFLYLLGVHLAGLWMDLPWWTPWLLWALFVPCLWLGLRGTGPGAGSLVPHWLIVGSWGLALAAFGWLVAMAAFARIPPTGPTVNLASPLPPGRYLVVNGGSGILINGHLETLNPRTPRQAAYRGQSYGIDIVGLTLAGRTAAGWKPREPERYAIFGTAVLAPCNGQVVALLDGRRDLPVPETDVEVMAGNHVVVRCGQVQVLLAHLHNGSVSVRQGEQVGIGQKLGEVGNSGSSDGPHLHIHAQRPGARHALFAGDPLPLRINGRYLVRGERL